MVTLGIGELGSGYVMPTRVALRVPLRRRLMRHALSLVSPWRYKGGDRSDHHWNGYALQERSQRSDWLEGDLKVQNPFSGGLAGPPP